jgi:hypothetical protein
LRQKQSLIASTTHTRITTKQPNNQTTKQPNNQTTKQPNNQTTKQPNNQTTKQPTTNNKQQTTNNNNQIGYNTRPRREADQHTTVSAAAVATTRDGSGSAGTAPPFAKQPRKNPAVDSTKSAPDIAKVSNSQDEDDKEEEKEWLKFNDILVTEVLLRLPLFFQCLIAQ